MKRIISDVVGFPNGCETVRYTACLVSMLMRAERMTDGGAMPLSQKHEELYHLYTAVTGFGFLQIDLSSDHHMRTDWNQTCNEMLRAFDWYIGFSMDYAGYDFEELIFADDDKVRDFAKIKASIDRNVPVLALFGSLYQWVLITGYDDDGVLYGMDGSQGYWGKPCAEPAGYDENGLFIMPDWHEKGGHAFILGEKKEPTVTKRDVFQRAIRIMECMKEKKYCNNSVDFLRDDTNFENLSDKELLNMRDRISGWIGQPIDQRAMIGYAMNPLRASDAPAKEIAAYSAVHGLCSAMHDALWIAWRGVGEYMGGDALNWARGLQNKIIRQMLADCFKFVQDQDEYMLERLKEGFA